MDPNQCCDKGNIYDILIVHKICMERMRKVYSCESFFLAEGKSFYPGSILLFVSGNEKVRG